MPFVAIAFKLISHRKHKRGKGQPDCELTGAVRGRKTDVDRIYAVSADQRINRSFFLCVFVLFVAILFLGSP